MYNYIKIIIRFKYKMNFEEAVSNFYKKKKRYDSKLKEQKKNIRENDDLSLE